MSSYYMPKHPLIIVTTTKNVSPHFQMPPEGYPLFQLRIINIHFRIQKGIEVFYKIETNETST